MICYFNGNFVPKSEVNISPDDRGFLFADGLYEVVRSYAGNFFRMQDHLLRLRFGAKEMGFNRTDFSYLENVAKTLLDKNSLSYADAMVYFQVTRGIAPRSHAFPSQETPLTEYGFAKEIKPDFENQKVGINLCSVPDQRWARCNIKSIALLPNTLAHQNAKSGGYQEALFIRDGAMMEGTHSNVFFVKDGTVITPPLTNYILGGITRKVVLELCRTLDIPFHERTIMINEIDSFQEAFVTSTTLEVTPVIQLDQKPIGSRKPGYITQTIQNAFKELTK